MSKINEFEGLSQKDFQALQLGKLLLDFHNNQEMVSLLDNALFLISTRPLVEDAQMNQLNVIQKLFFMKWIFEDTKTKGGAYAE